jgi:multidrug efflux pump subunit AcrB
MAVALLTSLVLALSFTPVLAERFIKDPHAGRQTMMATKNKADVSCAPSFDATNRYSNSRSIIVGLSYSSRFFYSSAHTFFTKSRLGILPAFDEGAFVLDYTAPPGSSLAETNRMLQHVEGILKDTPEMESYSRRTGLQLGLSITEPNTGIFSLS